MKYLTGAFACLLIAVSWATAQQETPPKTTPSIQPTAETLMKAADKTQTKREEVSSEELKKFVEREIAKAAALPVTTTIQEPIKPTVSTDALKDLKLDTKISMIFVEGGAYMRIGNMIVAMAGSECFLSEEEVVARRLRVQAKFAEMEKAESGKTEPAKKD
jgi:hypothetical protein